MTGALNGMADISPWLAFGLAALAVWRLTHLLQAEEGPCDVFARTRAALGASFCGRLMDCFYCLSMWVALPAALLIGRDWREWLFLWLGLSGAAILVERLHAVLLAREAALGLPALYAEEPLPEAEGGVDELLRK